MNEFLKSWTINIVTLSIFISILEMILPKSNMKKYIEMVVGILIIIVIINPFIKLVTNNINIEQEVFAIMNRNNEIVEDEKLQDVQKKQLISIYKNKVKNDIRKIVEESSGYSVKEILLDIEVDDEKNFGRLNKVAVKLNEKEKTDNDGVQKVNIKVESIAANKDLNKDNTYIKVESAENIINDKYNIQPEDILFYYD